MDLTRWLLRMSLWARHPPPRWKVMLAAGVIVLALLLSGIEDLFGWPEWLTLNKPIRMLHL